MIQHLGGEVHDVRGAIRVARAAMTWVLALLAPSAVLVGSQEGDPVAGPNSSSRRGDQ